MRITKFDSWPVWAQVTSWMILVMIVLVISKAIFGDKSLDIRQVYAQARGVILIGIGAGLTHLSIIPLIRQVRSDGTAFLLNGLVVLSLAALSTFLSKVVWAEFWGADVLALACYLTTVAFYLAVSRIIMMKVRKSGNTS